MPTISGLKENMNVFAQYCLLKSHESSLRPLEKALTHGQHSILLGCSLHSRLQEEQHRMGPGWRLIFPQSIHIQYKEYTGWWSASNFVLCILFDPRGQTGKA